MRRSLVEQVRERAGGVCEYCRMPEAFDDLAFQIDHVIAASHGGPTDAANLCLACFQCNSFKGPNLAGVDPQSDAVAPLFNPRRQKWARHFRWAGAALDGRTTAGRATVATLRVNEPHRVAHRQALIEEGVFPQD